MFNRDRLTIGLAFLSPLLGWIAERRYQQLPRLAIRDVPCTDHGNSGQAPAEFLQLPSLSIIVPARNEALNLQRLLPSLCSLDYPGQLELIVVNDNSVDDTEAIAREYGVHVVSLDHLPDGWLGKPHALDQGTAVAHGEWLLFTDADTIHNPEGPASAVSYALEHGLDGLSCHLGHKTYGWLDSLTLTAAYAGLFAGLPKGSTFLNGQYILLHRDVYAQSGGFAAVRAEAMDDLAMGHHLHTLDYQVPMLSGEDIAEVAMYQNSGELWRGMSRIGAGSLHWTGSSSLITALFVTTLMTPLLAFRLVLARRLSPHWLWVSWFTAVGGLWTWSKRFGARRYILLAPFGALFVQGAAVWGLINKTVGRGISWKGRSV